MSSNNSNNNKAVQLTKGTEWVDFDLGEDIRDEDRLKQDEQWANAVADGRAHVSHRELTMLYAPQLCISIEDYKLVRQMVDVMYDRNKNKNSLLRRLNPETLRQVIEFAFPGLGPLVYSFVSKKHINAEIQKLTLTNEILYDPFKIYVRKRPLFKYEIEMGAYDICDIDTDTSLTLHDGKLARNGRQLSMTHRQFTLDKVFPENISNSELCGDIITPLLLWTERGGNSTVLCFGQTGTGKTYTLYGALEFISQHLKGKSVKVTFFEVHGKKCYDLLSNRNIVHLRSDENENMHVRGAKSVIINCISEDSQLIGLLQEALSLRSSKVTERNSISSRSHAVCSIEILFSSNSDENKAVGKITLVDLAGSERNYETTKMTGAQHKESADINFSLMALKNCFRAFSQATHATTTDKSISEGVFKPIRIPYRDSLLTRVLKDCFASGPLHKTIIIATISPTPVDLQHSVNTLDHVILMSSHLSKLAETVVVEVPMVSGAASSHTPLSQWTCEQVIAWITTTERGRFKQLVIPSNIDGKELLKLSINNLNSLVASQLSRIARREEEGSAWVVPDEGDDESDVQKYDIIGRALWSAIRRENQSILAHIKSKSLSNSF